MVINALDEILFWSDISKIMDKMKELDKKYYPDHPEIVSAEKKKFKKQEIPTKEEFLRRLEYYEKNGKPIWVGGRNDSCDDISFESLKKSITESSKSECAENLAKMCAPFYSKDPGFWKFYVDNILYGKENTVLELTVGAGLGTSALMQRMSDNDLYMGVDIDFICAKQADAYAKYYNVNGLGIATSLWNMPFDDAIFSSVCSSMGLDECREVPTIVKEAARVLKSHGRLVLNCRIPEYCHWYEPFKEYGFGEDETAKLLERVRLYSGCDQLIKTVTTCGFKLIDKKIEKIRGNSLVFEKI